MELYSVTLAAGPVVALKESDQYGLSLPLSPSLSLSLRLRVCLFSSPSFINPSAVLSSSQPF